MTIKKLFNIHFFLGQCFKVKNSVDSFEFVLVCFFHELKLNARVSAATTYYSSNSAPFSLDNRINIYH